MHDPRRIFQKLVVTIGWISGRATAGIRRSKGCGGEGESNVALAFFDDVGDYCIEEQKRVQQRTAADDGVDAQRESLYWKSALDPKVHEREHA